MKLYILEILKSFLPFYFFLFLKKKKSLCSELYCFSCYLNPLKEIKEFSNQSNQLP